MAAGCATLTAPSPRQGGKWKLLMRIFANPNLPQIDDYYEPFTFDYDHRSRRLKARLRPPRPRSLITGKRMEKIEGPELGRNPGRRVQQAQQGQELTMSRRTSTASSKTPS